MEVGLGGTGVFVTGERGWKGGERGERGQSVEDKV